MTPPKLFFYERYGSEQILISERYLTEGNASDREFT